MANMVECFEDYAQYSLEHQVLHDGEKHLMPSKSEGSND